MPTQAERFAALEERYDALEAKYLSLQKQISAIRNKKVKPRQEIPRGQCHLGNDPKACPAAKPYRYQQGCHGESCETANRVYYQEHPRKGKLNGTPVKINGTKKVLRAPSGKSSR